MDVLESRGFRWDEMRTSSTVVTGWLLYGLVRFLRPEVIYEIGAYHGHSTVFLALAAKHNAHGSVYAFEPNRAREEGRERVAELVGTDAPVSWHGDIFETAGLPKADLVFLDLDPKCVYKDVLNLYIYNHDAIVCAHDLYFEPQRQAMEEFTDHAIAEGWKTLPLKGERGMLLLTRARA